MKRIALVLVLVGGLVLPATAAAKGPESGSIAGPGLAEPLRLTGLGEPGSVGTLGRVAEHGGLFAALGGPDWGALRAERPADDLGPRYTASFVMRDVKRLTVVVHLYPYARPAPVTYVPPGQKPFGTAAMGGGWFVAGDELTAALREAGLPAAAPAAGDGSGSGLELPQPIVLAPALLVALALVTAGALVLRRRVAPVR